MQLVDSHAHIYLEQFSDDIDEVIARSIDTGIEKIYMPNIDHTSIDDMLELADQYPDICVPMMGLHPCSVDKDFEKELYLVEDWLSKAKFAAVGEIGTDLYWDETYWGQQQEALKVQLDLARQHDLPFVIHCRDSIDQTIDIVKQVHSDNSKGVFHCFTGTVKQAEEITSLGYKIGIGGVATFKNGGLDQVIQEIDLEHILLETDSPYLAPTPNRGKRNEPSYISLVCNRIAEFKNLDPEEVGTITSANSIKLFSKNGS
jgi:TatD DNase family protein